MFTLELQIWRLFVVGLRVRIEEEMKRSPSAMAAATMMVRQTRRVWRKFLSQRQLGGKRPSLLSKIGTIFRTLAFHTAAY